MSVGRQLPQPYFPNLAGFYGTAAGTGLFELSTAPVFTFNGLAPQATFKHGSSNGQRYSGGGRNRSVTPPFPPPAGAHGAVSV